MKVLLITTDNLLRDQIKVGLQQFPTITVTLGASYAGVNELRTNDFDFVFLELGKTPQDVLTLIDHLRSFNVETEVVALADERTTRDLSREKQRHGIHAFLRSPLDVTEFFRLVARLRDRTEDVPEPVVSGRRR